MRFGAEFEVAYIEMGQVARVITDIDGWTHFKLGDDASIRPHGVEIKTRNVMDDDNDLGIIRELFKGLKMKGGKSNGTCGLHIHRDKPLQWDESKLKDIFDVGRLGDQFRPRRSRRNYCNPNTFGMKTSAIRMHPQGTIEFRFFNGCLNFRYFLKCLQISSKLMIAGAPYGDG